MGTYVDTLCQQFTDREAPKKVYGAAAHVTILPDEIAQLDKEEDKTTQQVIGVCLPYTRVAHDAILSALNTVTST